MKRFCACAANQDGGRRGRGGSGPRAAGAEDGGPEENLHQVDEQRLLQERGETGRDEEEMITCGEKKSELKLFYHRYVAKFKNFSQNIQFYLA